MNKRTRIKFCGMTRKQDVDVACLLGVDALGFVFVPKSPRFIEPEKAALLCSNLPPFVARVALFMNASQNQVEKVLKVFKADYLQFHGAENAAFCESWDVPYLKAVAMADEGEPGATVKKHPATSALLLDSHKQGEQGGSGQPFAWDKLKQWPVKPLILAGGLSAGNVAEAIKMMPLFAVDVSSGIEESPGIKSAEKMQAFVKAVEHADKENSK